MDTWLTSWDTWLQNNDSGKSGNAFLLYFANLIKEGMNEFQQYDGNMTIWFQQYGGNITIWFEQYGGNMTI